mgnify:CR=1 FL=1
MESHDEDPDPEDEEMEPDVLSPAEMPILDPRVDADYMDDEILFVIHGARSFLNCCFFFLFLLLLALSPSMVGAWK